MEWGGLDSFLPWVCDFDPEQQQEIKDRAQEAWAAGKERVAGTTKVCRWLLGGWLNLPLLL